MQCPPTGYGDCCLVFARSTGLLVTTDCGRDSATARHAAAREAKQRIFISIDFKSPFRLRFEDLSPESVYTVAYMKKTFIVVPIILLVLAGGLFALKSFTNKGDGTYVASDYKNAEYVIEGERVKLINGVAEEEIAPGATAKKVTRYFGNELVTDLNDDGRDDVVFLVTQDSGGTGIFYYVVAALNTEWGYVGSEDAVLLGDRIAPQTTEESRNPRHVNVFVVNYADRGFDDPMTTPPYVGKSIWLKLDPETMRFGVVEGNFEGESNL